MDKLNEVLKRLKRQYEAYDEERDYEDEDGMIDVSLACNLADSIPYLIEVIEKSEEERIKSFHEGYKQGLFDAEMKRLTDEE